MNAVPFLAALALVLSLWAARYRYRYNSPSTGKIQVELTSDFHESVEYRRVGAFIDFMLVGGLRDGVPNE